MKSVLVAALVLPLLAGAKSETSRIEIALGKRPVVTIEGAESAGQFTIMPEDGVDIADWAAGAVDAPGGKPMSVRFYCNADGETPAESVPSHLCYGVRYIPDPAGGGYIQIPAANDKEFPRNTASIYRGIEGRWYRSTARWEEVVRPRLEAAMTERQRERYVRDYYRYRDDYYYRDNRYYGGRYREPYRPPASSGGVSARPTMKPKR